MTSSICFQVQERSQVGESRRLACAWADERGCSKQQQGRLALLISELAANLAVHANDGGFLILQIPEEEHADGVEVLSLDGGPGSANSGVWLQDGFSTAGTAGTGLGAVRRASDLFEIHSIPRVGTAILSQLRVGTTVGHKQCEFGMVNVPKKGQTVCGDAVAHYKLSEGRTRMMVADGLGHGPLAAQASAAAVTIFKNHPLLDLPLLLEKMHAALKPTRGAAVAIAEADPLHKIVRFAGVGNVAATILNSDSEYRQMVSLNGTVGLVLPRLQEFTYPWLESSLLVLASDGLKTQWRLERYAGLLTRHPSLVAGVLFRDFSRHSDDTTVAILRNNSPA